MKFSRGVDITTWCCTGRHKTGSTGQVMAGADIKIDNPGQLTIPEHSICKCVSACTWYMYMYTHLQSLNIHVHVHVHVCLVTAKCVFVQAQMETGRSCSAAAMSSWAT